MYAAIDALTDKLDRCVQEAQGKDAPTTTPPKRRRRSRRVVQARSRDRGWLCKPAFRYRRDPGACAGRPGDDATSQPPALARQRLPVPVLTYCV